MTYCGIVVVAKFGLGLKKKILKPFPLLLIGGGDSCLGGGGGGKGYLRATCLTLAMPFLFTGFP